MNAIARITIAFVFFVSWLFPALGGYDEVVPGRAIEFPKDRGAHLGHRIEWWYVTGQVHPKGDTTRTLGFQVTFFRVRNPDAESNPSRFAPSQSQPDASAVSSSLDHEWSSHASPSTSRRSAPLATRPATRSCGSL